MVKPRTKASVREATTADVATIGHVLSRAFEGDPFDEWMFPDSALRPARSRRLYALEAGFEYLPHGRVEVAELDGRVVGAALWGDPDARDTWVALRVAPHLPEIFGMRRLPTVLKGLRRLEEHFPRHPHRYLAELGTDPDVRGSGAGKALLLSGLARADRSGLPTYLESSKAENLPFYERFGFRTTAAITVPDGPTLYAMSREPGAGETPA
ncbi:GNAT family N-acetyltransferase [Nocardiopsis alba]|jgi:GNAT superfamily N-acetyltransferase|uniref:GNAT family N-acetyltransferase n=1 Tax=Nocardiopsis alba TaxID=53437 RepID=UPI0033B53B8B